MKFNTMFRTVLLLALTGLVFSACQQTEEMQSKTYSYMFNTGQINSAYAYSGTHPTTLSADLKLEEMADDKTKITVTINNPESGQTYMVHAHDKVDPATNNGLPYNQVPNATVFAQPISGGEASFTSDMSFEKLTTEYEAFFVIHDPLQPINTADPTTYVILGDFARE